MQVATIGLDIARRVFQAHGVDATGRAVVRRKPGRSEVLDFFRALLPCLAGIEACGTAHHWAREIRALGHEVRLIPAADVKPRVRRGRTDAADAQRVDEVEAAIPAWHKGNEARRPRMVAAVAQAGKAARIVRALLACGGICAPQRSAPR